jgi:hypothetical protein
MKLHKLKTLGLLMLAVLGVMAVASTAAQAEFLLEGKTFAEAKVTKETVTGGQKTPTKISVPALGVTYQCESGTIPEGFVEVGGLDLHRTVWSNCHLLDSKGVEIKACTVDEIAANFTSLLLRHEGRLYDVLFPESGAKPTTLITTILNLGAECPLPKELKFTGIIPLLFGPDAVAVTDTSVTTTEEESLKKLTVTHLGLMWKFGMNVGVNPAFLSYSGTTSLSGANKGKKWGGD